MIIFHKNLVNLNRKKEKLNIIIDINNSKCEFDISIILKIKFFDLIYFNIVKINWFQEK